MTAAPSAAPGVTMLTASCCKEAIRNTWVPLDGTGRLLWSLSTNSISVPANGKYLPPVVAKEQFGSGGANAATNVGIRVLPASEPAPSCKPSTLPTHRIATVLDTQINNTEAALPKTKLIIAMFMPGERAVGEGDLHRWLLDGGEDRARAERKGGVYPHSFSTKTGRSTRQESAHTWLKDE